MEECLLNNIYGCVKDIDQSGSACLDELQRYFTKLDGRLDDLLVTKFNLKGFSLVAHISDDWESPDTLILWKGETVLGTMYFE